MDSTLSCLACVKRTQHGKRPNPQDIITHGVWVGDRSASMFRLVNYHRKGYNDFLKEQTKLPGKFFLTTVAFDDKIELVGDKDTPITKVPHANLNSFVPRGNTSLNDAIGFGIGILEQIQKTNDTKGIKATYWLGIMTDGEENSSKKFTVKQIKKKVQLAKTKGWTIQYMAEGSLEKARTVGGYYGILSKNCAGFHCSPAGMLGVMRSVSSQVTKQRCTGEQSKGFTQNETRQMSLAGSYGRRGGSYDGRGGSCDGRAGSYGRRGGSCDGRARSARSYDGRGGGSGGGGGGGGGGGEQVE